MDELECLRQEYERLLLAMDDAVRMMDQQNYGIARKRLKRAAWEAEKRFPKEETYQQAPSFQHPPLDNPAPE